MITAQFYMQRDDNEFDFDFVVPSQGVTALFGVSGAGKSTLLELLAGIITPQRGHFSLDGEVLFDSQRAVDVAIEQRQIGIAFQDNRLFPHMSVLENLSFALPTTLSPSQRKKLDEVVDLLGLRELLQRKPTRLSGGEQKRVAIGRCLMSRPKLLLLDEPLAGVDGKKKEELMGYVSRLVQNQNIPVIFVSHDTDEIMQLADYIVLIENGKSIIHGTLSNLWTEKEIWSRLPPRLISSVITGEVIEKNSIYNMMNVLIGEGINLWAKDQNFSLQDKVRLSINANDVVLSKHKLISSMRNCFLSSIVKIDRNRNDGIVTVTLLLSDQKILANISEWALEDLQLSLGDPCYVLFKGLRVNLLR
uniref:molybdenum ABC transporter ATP-binding protein n=1 Tax=Thaumasiovibrio occultus TaxID=1891184 RepID=UPI00131C01EA|nr:molybdenum ABC transporter ATP-binding protein [Thaumasiovibrio occultus]